MSDLPFPSSFCPLTANEPPVLVFLLGQVLRWTAGLLKQKAGLSHEVTLSSGKIQTCEQRSVGPRMIGWWSILVLVVFISPLTLGERVTSLTPELSLENL